MLSPCWTNPGYCICNSAEYSFGNHTSYFCPCLTIQGQLFQYFRQSVVIYGYIHAHSRTTDLQESHIYIGILSSYYILHCLCVLHGHLQVKTFHGVKNSKHLQTSWQKQIIIMIFHPTWTDATIFSLKNAFQIGSWTHDIMMCLKMTVKHNNW